MNNCRGDRAALVALLREVGLDDVDLATLLEATPPGELLADWLALDGDQTVLLADDPSARLAAANSELSVWEQAGRRLISVRDADYPVLLRLVHDRPAALFAAGPLDLSAAPAIAVIGSRNASEDGLSRARRMATELVHAGQVVVSGLAAGIDTAVHSAAIAAGGRTVAVLGTGLDHAYPPENRGLQQELAAAHAVVSPFWPGAGPAPEHFRRRNGVMSGISRATVIVEASAHSGTRVQARLALGHGRPVCLMEPVLEQPWAVELLQRPGVHVVGSAAEVLAVSRWADGDTAITLP